MTATFVGAASTGAWLAVPSPVDADLSPDGRVLAVTSVRVPASADEEVTRLSLVDIASGTVERFAPAFDGDASAVWSPHGDRLAFVTTRTGRPQLAVADVGAVSAEVVTDLADGVSGPPAWSPDGSRLAFAASRGRVLDRSLPYRITRPVPWGDGIGSLHDPPQLWALELGTQVCERLTDDEWRWSRPRWSPDGQTIAARASHDPTGRRRGQHLRVVALDASWFAPAVPGGFAVVHTWSPGGLLVALTVQPDGHRLGARGELHVVGPEGVRELTAGVEFGCGGDVYGDSPAELGDSYDHALVVDGETAWVRVADGGRLGLARVDLVDGATTWQRVLAGDRCVTPVGAAGGRVVVAEQRADLACRVVALDAADPETLRVLPLAPDAYEVAPPSPAEVRRFTVPSPADGFPIEAWFLAAGGASGPLPTVLIVHGGPMAAFGEAFSLDAQALCAAGFGVLYANPHGSTGYGDAFTHSVIADWGGAPVADVLAVIDHAVAQGWTDGDRVGMTGNSYGGYLTAWMAATTTRFRAAVVENPVTDLLSMYGTSDIGALFLPAQLDCGPPSEVLVLPGASHEGSTYGPVACRLAHDEALVDWMRQWLLQ